VYASDCILSPTNRVNVCCGGWALLAKNGITFNLPGHILYVSDNYILATNDCQILFELSIHLHRFQIIELYFYI